MDQRAAEIIKEIEQSRLRLGDSVEELQTKLRDVSDWRTYYQRNPWLAIGLAAGGGLLLSGLFATAVRSQNGR